MSEDATAWLGEITAAVETVRIVFPRADGDDSVVPKVWEVEVGGEEAKLVDTMLDGQDLGVDVKVGDEALQVLGLK